MNLSRRTIRTLVTLLVIGAAAPFMIWGAMTALHSMHNSPPAWVPDSLPYRQDYDWYKHNFGTQDSVLVSWPAATIDDEALERFDEALMSPDDPKKREHHRELFQRVVTGPELVDKLTGEPTNFYRDTAVSELHGSFVGQDGQTSAALVVLTPYGSHHRPQMREAMLETAAAVSGLPAEEIRLAGPAIDGEAIDRASLLSIDRFALPSMIIATLLCWWCLRSISFTAIIVAAAACGQGLVLSLVNFSGHEMNAILIVMPPLAFVLTVSAGVHLANYYRDGVKQHGPAAGASLAVRHGWLPCVLATATTVIGLGSLLVSDFVPVKVFGCIASVGVVCTLALLFLLLPGVMDWHAKTRTARRWAVAQRAAPGAGERWLDWLAGAVSRRPTIIALLFTASMVALLWGFVHIRTSVNVRSLFPLGSPIMSDYAWMEEEVGPLVPIEVILQFDDEQAEYTPLDRMALVRYVHEEVADMELADGVVSASTFFPTVPGGVHQPGEKLGGRQVGQRRGLENGLEDAMEDFHERRWVVETDRGQAWRISARASALGDVDYGHFLDTLKERIDPLLAEEWGDGVAATYTGSMPVTYEAQRALLGDLFRSFLTAFVLVALVMIVVLRSAAGGLLVMLPNVFPTLVLFGIRGWLKEPIDIGSVMTASVALGIAVDDTLHFINWYRHELAKGNSRLEAVRRCYHHCGRAMVQTSLICGLGLMVYAFSSFVPTQHFAFMMVGLLMAALVGDLIFLPALLLSPLGKVVGMPAEQRAAPQPNREAALEEAAA